MKKRILVTIGLLGLAALIFVSCKKRGLVLTEGATGGNPVKESIGKDSFEPEVIPLEHGDLTEETEEEAVCVYICGAVLNPGIVNLPREARINDALKAAGGFADGAKTEEINLAQKVTDGQQIRIPYEGEEAVLSGESEEENDDRVNINTADEKGLVAIPGIGESRAKAIVEYRNKHGAFKKIEDIMRVSGIKEGTFEKIKAYIKI